MSKKCPRGVICIENVTLVIILILISIILYFSYFNLVKYISNAKLYSKNEYTLNMDNSTLPKTGLFSQPGYSFSNIENDVLLNPYQAPLRDNRLFPNSSLNNMPNRMPINVPTQSYDTNYRQIGLLTRIGEKETMLPLMGRPLMANRDKWNFYTMSDTNNMLKLPVSIANGNSKSSCNSGSNSYKKCMAEHGCNDLYSGDTVKVDGYNDLFKVTTYENNTPQYIPYI